MSELQPGMLALVVGYRINHKNLGKIVTAKEKVFNGYVGPDGAEFISESGWLVVGEGLSLTSGGKFVDSPFCYIEESHLLPIKPEADPLEIKVNQELHA